MAKNWLQKSPAIAITIINFICKKHPILSLYSCVFAQNRIYCYIYHARIYLVYTHARSQAHIKAYFSARFYRFVAIEALVVVCSIWIGKIL